MNIRTTLLLLVMAPLSQHALGQAPFQSLIGEEVQSLGESVLNSIATSDGGLIAVIRRSGGERFMMKIDADGQTLWSGYYAIGVSGAGVAGVLLAASDGGAFMVMKLVTIDNTGGDIPLAVIARIDGNGTVVWSKRYRMPPVNPIDHPFYETSMTVLQNDELQVTFYAMASSGSTHTLRLDQNGSVQWAQKETESEGANWCHVRGANDGSTVLMQMDQMGITYPIRLTRFGADGTLNWSKRVRMTNAIWQCTHGSTLLSSSGDCYIHGRQDPIFPPDPFLFLIKISPAGELDWYRVYGNGTNDIISSTEQYAYELPNTDLQFGLLSRNTFSTSGEHLSSVARSSPSWTSGAYSYFMPIGSTAIGPNAALVHGQRRRIDNLFSTSWTTSFLGRIDLDAPLDCGWTETTAPVMTDTVPPAELIDFQDGVPWISIAVDVADTSVVAVPFTLPVIVPYCAPVGMNELHADANTLTALPNYADPGYTVQITTTTGGALLLIDQAGRRISTTNVPQAMTLPLSTGNLAPGVYLLQLVRDDGRPSAVVRLTIG